MSRRSATAVVAVSFLGATAAFIGFVAAYLLDASTQLLGVLVGVAFGALAVGLLAWSRRLLPGEELVETRKPVAPDPGTQDTFVDALERAPERTPRMVRRTLMLSGLGLLAAVAVPLRSLVPAGTPYPSVALSRSSWRTGTKRLMTTEGRLVRPEDFPVGSLLTVLPEGEPDNYYATGILLRLSSQEVGLLPAGVRRYTVSGLIAFSKLCTHAGCPVGLYEQTAHELFCPCHQSAFDVLQGARPVAGPAARPLPQLPLAVDSAGYLMATGDFRGRPGPTFWTRYGGSS